MFERNSSDLDKAQLLKMYRDMLRIRRFEEKMDDLAALRVLPINILSPYTGEEAIAVGVIANLRKDDYIASAHRCMGHLIARGVDIRRMIAEVCGKKTGCSKGKGGRMGIVDSELHIIANGIVGWGIPIAAGFALNFKLKRTDQVAVSFFGDGGANTGVFHESLNMSSLWKLPVIYVVENNQQSLLVGVKDSLCVENISEWAIGYHIAGMTVDGTDALAVYEAAKAAVERARSGGGPTLLECKTPPLHGAYEGAGYPKLKLPLGADPIENLRKKMLDWGVITPDEVVDVEKAVRDEVEAAAKFAEDSPEPMVEEALEDVFYKCG